MDFSTLKQAAGSTFRAVGKAAQVLKTSPGAGLLTALIAGFVAGRLSRRAEASKPTAPADK